MTTEVLQNRFDFPHPIGKEKAVMQRIIALMADGKRRSKKEMRRELGLDEDVEITARIRDARRPENGAWPFNDARKDGPDPDGVYRYQMATPKARVQP